MRDVIVALDLETTGLNKDADAIIEIGAARFENGEVLDTFETLINPGRPIPERITAITGIRSEDVIDAPRIHEVLNDLRQFVGHHPVVGHRVDFDLGFLSNHRVATTNMALDTYDLASVVLPTVARYNLTHLTTTVGLELEHAHRALDDAIATGRLYWVLWERVLDLPLATLQEIVEAARNLDWNAKPVFMAALQERSQTALTGRSDRPLAPTPEDLFQPAEKGWPTLRPNAEIVALDVDHLAATIEEGGRLAEALPNFEPRQQQVDMLCRVTDAFNNGEHVMVEAPTGVGKSLAYLVPAIYWATHNNERVVISTNTINLQDQLLDRDLPFLERVLGIPFRAAVVKGRSNYLCPRRLLTLRRRGPTSEGELRVLAKILVWLLESDSGDRGEISLRGYEENVVWSRLSAADEGCTLARCADQMHGVCPFYKARRKAESAHILVVNHALLLSDVQIGNRVLPDYRYLVIDEGHHLEDATTDGLSYQVNQITLLRQIADLGSPTSGLLGDVLRSTHGSVPPNYFEQIEAYVDIVTASSKAMGHHVRGFFDTLYTFLDSSRLLKRGEFVNQVRITDEIRQRPNWAQVEEGWEILSQFTEGIADAMDRLAKGLAGLGEFDIPEYDDLLSSVQAAARHLGTAHLQIGSFSIEPQVNMIYWAQAGEERERLSIHAAPLHVGPLLEEHLWHTKHSVILTSATLRTGGTFEYMRERLNAFEVNEVVVGTPFDYEATTLVYIPTDMPEPNRRDDYQRFVERGLIELAAATEGRLLGLFTSYSQLRQTAQNITPRLSLGNITVFDQSDGTSRQALLEGFKQTERAVLLGTRSFWEGVDVPGDDLVALVIARLPFAVPSDPIFAARAELYQNSFMQYAVPDAILRFRQGFGRLIRTTTDRGVVALFDNRVITKRYGQLFLDSLPTCTVRRGPLADLPRVAVEWIDG
ncbi:MAG: DEAD/DEAH box helicase [Chloroflexi bacterium]|nr:DEAD/DEAH box helicase [Chloroflexota bacterium]